jgi:hypothetical protein
MVRPSNGKRRKKENLSKARHAIKLHKMWQERVTEFDSFDLGNSKGRCRTEHENKLVLLTLKLVLKLYVEKVEAKDMQAHELSWTLVETRVAEGLQLRRDQVSRLRQLLFDDGTVGVFGDGEEGTRGRGSPVSKEQNNKLTNEQLTAMVKEVDDCHAQGSTVNCTLMKNYLNKEFKVDVHETTIANYFKKIGLSYKPIKAKKRNIGAYRMDLLRDYLISFNDLYKVYVQDPVNCPFVFVFTDESYIHKGLGTTNSWTKGDSIINKSASKGTRLIMIHAITPFGPLCEIDKENNKPVDDLDWKGDTCHPKPRTDNKLTCEAMWKAESHTGDYHDNMNLENFQKWVEQKLVPTFEKLYPNKQMILICDNAPYHHKRQIGSLSSKSKQQLLQLGVKHNIEYIDLPLTVERLAALSEIGELLDDVQYLSEEYCRVAFNPEKFKQHSANNKPFIPNIDELRMGILKYIQDNKPELLDCEIEGFLKQRGHRILWTPPYSPDLQPIELFWAAGKNHARLFARNGITMRETVQRVREGWYGSIDKRNEGDEEVRSNYRDRHKAAINCNALFEHTIVQANTKFIPICTGISGVMGDLKVDENHVVNRQGLPIDMLVLSCQNLPDNDDEINIVNENDDNEAYERENGAYALFALATGVL